MSDFRFDMNDPSKNKEQWTTEAKMRAAVMTPERLAELRARFPDARTTGSGSSKQSNRSLSTYGTMDAVSVPIYDEWGRDPFMTGPSNDFLFLVGSGQTFNEDGVIPRQLRQNGWVYLRAGGHLVARVQYKGVERRDTRIEHVSSPEGYEDRGPGLVLAVDPATWEPCTHRLASSSESGNGYRYYMMDDEHPVWTRTST